MLFQHNIKEFGDEKDENIDLTGDSANENGGDAENRLQTASTNKNGGLGDVAKISAKKDDVVAACCLCGDSSKVSRNYNKSIKSEMDSILLFVENFQTHISAVTGQRLWGACNDCAFLRKSVSGTECAAYSSKNSGFLCLNGHVPIHTNQVCSVCGKFCHIQCSFPSQAPIDSQSRLFQGAIDLVCMCCSREKRKASNSFGLQDWLPLQAIDFSPVIFEFPFPISILEFKQTLVKSFDSPDTAKNEYQTSVRDMFKMGDSHFNDDIDELIVHSVVDETAWAPEGSLSCVTFTNLASVCSGKSGIGVNELLKWDEKKLNTASSLPFFNFSSKLRLSDLSCLSRTGIPTMNTVDCFISLLNHGSIDSAVARFEAPTVRNLNISCLPLLFMSTLLDVFGAFGRQGISRFVKAAIDHDCPSTPLVENLVGQTSVLLLPFQSLYSTDFYLGVVLIQTLDDEERREVNFKKSDFCLIRYSSRKTAPAVELSYVSILRDFIDVAILHSLGDSLRSNIGTLHNESTYHAQYSDFASLGSVVLNRVATENCMPIYERCFTQLLMDDIAYFFLNEESITQKVSDGAFDEVVHDFMTSWESNTIGHLDLVDSFGLSIKACIPLYLNSLFKKIDKLSFGRTVEWVEEGRLLTVADRVLVAKDVAFLPLAHELVKYICMEKLIPKLNKDVFGQFMRSVTTIMMMREKDEKFDFSRDVFAFSTTSLMDINCEVCAKARIGGLDSSRQIQLPLAGALDRWIEYLSFDGEYFFSFAHEAWNNLTRVIDDGDVVFAGASRYLNENHREIFDDVFDGIGTVISSLCKWELSIVEFLVQIISHYFHPPPDTAIACTNNVQMTCFVQDSHLIMCSILPPAPTITRIICTCLAAGADVEVRDHHVVMDVHVPSRQVFLYDGCDETIEVWKDEYGGKASAKSKLKSSCVEEWMKYCNEMLTMIQLLPEKRGRGRKTLNVVATSSPKDLRPLDKVCCSRAKWQLMPAHLVLDIDPSVICEQKDTYSCGAIAVTHVLHLLGHVVPPSNDIVEDRYISKVMTLPWKKLICNFVSSYLSPNIIPTSVRDDYISLMSDDQPAEPSKPTPESGIDPDDADDTDGPPSLDPEETAMEDPEVQESKAEKASIEEPKVTQPTSGEAPTITAMQDQAVQEPEVEKAAIEEPEVTPLTSGEAPAITAPPAIPPNTAILPQDKERKTFAPPIRQSVLRFESGPWDNWDPKTLTVPQLHHSLAFKLKSHSQELWKKQTMHTLLVDPLYDDNNCDWLIGGCPNWIKPMHVGENFPYVTHARYDCDVWEIRVVLNKNPYLDYTEIVPESFFEFIFTQDFVSMAEQQRRQWFRVLCVDYKWRNIAKLTVDWDTTDEETCATDQIPIGDIIDGASNFESKFYFYNGPVKNVDSVMHVVMQRPSMMRSEIEESFGAYRRRELISPTTDVQFFSFNHPLWFGMVLDKEGKYKVRRLYREWVYKNVPPEALYIAISEPHRWSYIKMYDEIEKEDEFNSAYSKMKTEQRKRKRDVEYVEIKAKQISHVLFTPYKKTLWAQIAKDFKLDGSDKYDFDLGYYFGITEETSDECELLYYDWIVDNLDKTYACKLTSRRWRDRWMALPAGAGLVGGERQKQRPRSSYKVNKSYYTEQKMLERAAQSLRIEFPPLEDLQISRNWPDIQFKQKEGEPTCIFFSMASALFYMGNVCNMPVLKRIASNIFNHANFAMKTAITTEERVAKLKQMLDGTFITRKKRHEKVSYPPLAANVQYAAMNTSRQFDPFLSSNQSLCPTLAICLSIDNSREHAVTFFGDWIFDSNEMKALPITKETLNRCAPFGFKGVLKAWTFGKHLTTSQIKTKKNLSD